jgi:hypothetical protein
MKRRVKKLRKVHYSTNIKSSLWQKIVAKLLKEKNFVVSIFVAIVTLGTFLFIYFTHESSPNVKCELDFIQRPDQLYQAQLYIWNDGDKIAENIIIWAKKEEVFLYDTSGNYKKGRLNVFLHLGVYSKITPSQYKDDAGRVQTFLNHQIILPQLSSSQKEDNYLVIGPNVGRNSAELEKLMSLPNSIYKFKFVKLGKTKNISSYKEDILDNVQVIHEGNKIEIQIGKTLPLKDIDTNKYYFPTFEEFDQYQIDGNIPNNIIPPLGNNDKVKKKKKDDDSWFFLFR